MLEQCDTAYITKLDYSYQADAWFPNLDGEKAWQITEESEEQTFDKREITIGLSDGIRVEILSGITADDKVRGAKEEKK